MFKTVRLGRLFGTDVFAHWTLWPLFAYLLVIGLLTGGLNGFWLTAQLLISLFLAVYLHELAHAIVAGLRGIRTRDIILLPIGGVARLQHPQIASHVELQIAAAGPLANIAIAGLSIIPLLVQGNAGDIFGRWFASGWLVSWVQINLILGVGNLLPALPLDGGRVLRAILTMRNGYLPATAAVVRITRYVGLAMLLLAPFVNLLLLLFGVFLLLVSVQEMLSARIRDLASGPQASNDWRSLFQQLDPHDSEENERVGSGKTVDAVQVRKL